MGFSSSSIPSFDFKQVKEIVDLIEQRSFPPLPGIDCKHCGFESCEKFAIAVVSGRRRWEECQALAREVVLKIDGRQIPLKPFVQEFLAGAIKGMVSSLKDTQGRNIEIMVINRDG